MPGAPEALVVYADLPPAAETPTPSVLAPEALVAPAPLALSAVAPVVVAWPSSEPKASPPSAPREAGVPEGDGRGAWTGDVFAPADLEVGAAPDPTADPDAFPVDLTRDVP